MNFALGVPEVGAGAPLPRRLAWVTAIRLLLLMVPLTLIAVFYLKGSFNVGSFSMLILLVTLGISFALAGLYAVLLRAGRGGEALAHTQLLMDQLVWTAVVYVSGGVSSGATSFYGLSCLVGAILTGTRGAFLAGVSGVTCYGALVLALQLGLLPIPPDQPPRLYEHSSAEVFYHVLVNGLVVVVVAVLAIYLAERLRLTGGKLEEERQRADHAERLAAMGRLAAGLAHEIRNPLSSISGSIQLLRATPGLSNEDRQLCDIVQRETRRLNDLVTDMLDLARRRPPSRSLLDLAALVRDVVELSSSSGRSATDVRVQFTGLPRLMHRVDDGQIRQLVWNLIRNAVQASTAGDVVKVDLKMEQDSAVLTVEDHGIGIDPTAKLQLFDAFFTTRSQGTGVGLAVVKRIADEHGFTIDVRSEEGEGTVFKVDLGEPAAEQAGDPD